MFVLDGVIVGMSVSLKLVLDAYVVDRDGDCEGLNDDDSVRLALTPIVAESDNDAVWEIVNEARVLVHTLDALRLGDTVGCGDMDVDGDCDASSELDSDGVRDFVRDNRSEGVSPGA